MRDTCFKLTVRFLLDEFHGRGEYGEPEWPPSPLRLFQALVNTASRSNISGDALEWLESQEPPLVVATPPDTLQPRYGFCNYVPDNVGDLVLRSWMRGQPNSLSDYRTAKKIRPLRLRENTAVHYLWPLTGPATEHVAALARAASHISAFGWGIDMVTANAEVITGDEAAALEGERWMPASGGGVALRVPVAGTLAELRSRHEAFLDRISLEEDAVFKPVPPLSQFSITDYRRSGEIARSPFAVFALREPHDRGFASFSPSRDSLRLGGMLRHCASKIAPHMGWDARHTAAFVLGHGEARGKPHAPVDGPRLLFIPLPSVEWRGESEGRAIGRIRRVLVTVNGSVPKQEFSAIARALEGGELVDEKTSNPVAVLRRERVPSAAVQDYLSSAREWKSVTPVVLPGYDDPRRDRDRLGNGSLTVSEKEAAIRRLDSRTDSLLRKALRQAGIPEPVVATAQLDWSGSGLLHGVERAAEYDVPEQHRRYRRLHVHIVFQEPFPGPLCIGGGRFTGTGAFAAVNV